MENYYELGSPVRYKYKNNKDIIVFKDVINKKDCQFIIDAIENRSKWEEAKTAQDAANQAVANNQG
jgi:DNA-binding transcriptional regulator WhiA